VIHWSFIVRAKQSLTASEMYRCFEPSTPPLYAAVPVAPAGATGGDRSPLPGSLLARPARRPSLPCPAIVYGEGLLHDARNLMGTLGLYCDLLSTPGVLKPEHRHYAEEVRVLGARSVAMIQQLMEPSLQALGAATCSWPNNPPEAAAGGPAQVVEAGTPGITGSYGTETAASPASLRSIVERCSGLLGRVADGKPIEISYGAAASVPVRVEEESVERILINLVRNSAAALGERTAGRNLPANPGGTSAGAPVCDAAQNPASTPRGSVRETVADPTADETPGSIRIGVGLLVNRVGDLKPWPFRRVRLTVEDSGCGMPLEQLERLLSGGRAPSRGSHGIGFRVVRELVVASAGDLRIMSAPGVGTRVQIEWPMDAAHPKQATESPGLRGAGGDRRQSC
jgi:signal transduction histidine kinase